MSKKIILKKEEIEYIQVLLNDGKSIKQISKILKRSEHVISNAIKENDLYREITNTEILRRKLPGYEELEKEICDYYLNNKINLTNLGEIFGLGICCVENILKKYNIDRLQASDFNKIYSLDENYFKNIDSDNKAYILGFFYADGCVGSNNNKVQISLQEDDVEILEKMRSEFQCDKPLRYIEPPKKFPNRKPQYSLSLDNKQFHENIVNQGVIQKKSYFAVFPFQIEEKYYKSFIRGVFDGDGCLYHYEKGNTNTVTFTGTSELINAIGDIIEKNIGIKKRIHVAQNSIDVDKNTRVLMFGGNKQVKKFLDWLYDGAELYLKRKYDKYVKLYNINNSLAA